MSLDRIQLSLLRAGLVGLAAFVVYCWMVRLGSDLAWDEALNFKTYARHPLTAIALYHEPNNHPLESFVKSIFYGVLGWNSPAFYRFTGFLFVVAYLALLWAWYREWSRRGSLVARTLLVVMMLLSAALNWQATVLRGYFLSIVLEFFYVLVLVRKTGLLDRGSTSGAGHEPWSRRVALRYAALSALILFAVPSNLLVLPAMCVLTAAAYHDPGERLGSILARGIRLAIMSVLVAAILYTPIFLGILTGVSRFHGVPIEGFPGVLQGIGGELSLTLAQLTPRGWLPSVVGAGLAALVLAAVAFRGRSALTWTALGVALTCLIPRIAIAAVVDYPSRIKSSLVPLLVFAAAALVQVVTADWSARKQSLAALVLVIASYASVPVLLREDRPYRTPSRVAEFLVTLCRPSERLVVVGHDGRQELQLYVDRAFGSDRTLDSYADVKARLGESPDGNGAPEESGWRHFLRAMIRPPGSAAALDVAKVDVLVLIDREGIDRKASKWNHPVLGALKARLSRTSTFSIEDYRITIFEAP